MTAAKTVCWGPVADEYGLCHWQTHQRTADGRGVERFEQWAADPASDYSRSQPSPMPAKWCHGSDLGRVIALRQWHGKLFATAELDEVTPDVLDELAERHGPLRWSASTSKVGRGPLTMSECSLTPRPASIGLAAVQWHQAGVSRGDPPMWVREDVKRGRSEVFRRHSTLDVFEADRVADDPTPLFDRSGGDRYRHNPNEIFYTGGVGRVIAVNGKPVNR